MRTAARKVRRALIEIGVDQPGLPRLLRPDIINYRGSPVRRVTRDGITYDLDLSDYVEWTIYWGVERTEKAALFDLANHGDVALDIGTNVGEVLMNLARRVGTTGQVIGFEPNPTTLAKCRHNLSLNHFSNVEVHKVALGDSPGEAMLGHPQGMNAGADRIGSSGVPVQVTTLDAFGDRLDRVDLIKIDVEGFDLKVLRGGEKLIERFHPVLFIEFCDANLREQGDSTADLIRWLKEHGYEITDCGSDIIARHEMNPPVDR